MNHFNRYSYDGGEVAFVNQNQQDYDLYGRSFYKEAKAKLKHEDEAFINFSSEKGDPRRVLAKTWTHGYVFASVEGLDTQKL